MSSKIASLVRRQMLVAGASFLGLPAATWAAGRPSFNQAKAGVPEMLPETVLAHVEGFTSEIDKSQLREGERLILSGRLTDVDAKAIAHAVITLVGIQTTTLSDVDGRFLFFATVPRGDSLELRVRTTSGRVLHKVVSLLGSVHPSAPRDCVVANSLYEGQGVWRSSFSLSMTA
jgi:hypothetical protein